MAAREIKSTKVFDGRIVQLYLEEVELPNGHISRMEIVHHPGAAAVLPLHDDGTVTLVYQYRHALKKYIHELPAGLLEPGEQPMACAARELEEEAGLMAAGLTPLVDYYATAGFSDEKLHLFLATGLTACDQRLEQGEILSVVRMPLDEALRMAKDGRISDGKTLIALLLSADGLAQGRLP